MVVGWWQPMASTLVNGLLLSCDDPSTDTGYSIAGAIASNPGIKSAQPELTESES